MITASWKKLILANYAINPEVLADFLPYKTEFDRWDNQCFVSLVGFIFADTTVLGIRFPFHVRFEEVNLRFYVKLRDDRTEKRGVVFIKEIVPLPGITLIANTFYNEHYHTMPMKHKWEITPQELNIEYQWKKRQWQTLGITTDVSPIKMHAGSEQMFFTDQHWGFTKINSEVTTEYEVFHPDWVYYKTLKHDIDVDFGAVYGEEFSFLSQQVPYSVFLAEGSAISLRKGGRIR